jgi:hypothetical protein
MENTKINNWTNRMNKYVNTTSRHLFMDENNRFFKVVPFKHGDKNMVASIRFNEKYFWVTISEVEAKSTQSLAYMKYGFFPQWDKTRTIPNFKLMREKSAEIKEILEKEYDGSAEKTSEIKESIKNITKDVIFLEKDLTTE